MTVEISFVCEERNHGNIAEPVPAKRIIEEWYKRLERNVPNFDTNISSFGQSVKACPPFLDVMMLGWILRVPADVKVEVVDNGVHFEAGWRYPAPIIEHHDPRTVVGHPLANKRAILKMFTMWAIQTPPGWSTMLFPPLNRAELPFEAMAAVIDTDTFKGRITVPCWINLPDGHHFVPKGTPLVQVVPFKREDYAVTMRAETELETKQRVKQEELMLSEIGGYQRNVRAKDRGG